MRRLLVVFATTLVGGAVLAPSASAALTAREIRIGDHPGFVRVVIDFTGGRVQTGEVVATDPNPFPDGFVRLPLTRAGVRTTADPVRDEGVFARIAQNSGKITIRLTGDDRRFKYVGYFAQHTPERLVLDLYKARPPTDAAEILRGRGGCLRLTDHTVTRRHVDAEGTRARPVRALARRAAAPQRRPHPPPEGRDGVHAHVEHELRLPGGIAAGRDAGGRRAVGEGRHAGLPGPGARAHGRKLVSRACCSRHSRTPPTRSRSASATAR